MSAKKWLICLVATVLALIFSLGAFNWAIDPFGLFGDRFFDWYAYNMTQNPRSSKIAYLDRHHGEYDSYIIGCSSTSAYPTETLNRYFDAKFYNMIMYGADLYDVECESRYILEHYECKNLVVNVYIDNALHYDHESDSMTYSQHAKTEGENQLLYYLRYLFAKPSYSIDKLVSASDNTYLKESFDAFNPLDGTYDKRARDVERIADSESYLQAYPAFADYPQTSPIMTKISEAAESIARIKAMCEEKGVNFVLVSAPVYHDYFDGFTRSDVTAYYTALANVTPFWDFSMSSVSYEMRYFYDETHFRNCVGDMALARMFGDESVWVPEDFGVYVTPDTVGERMNGIYASEGAQESEISAQVPVLLYHSISPDPNAAKNGMTVTPETFELQIAALAGAGYTAITVDALQEYVKSGSPLPEKPILITFDDGYADNYEYAYPILREYGMKATVFAIGSSIGKSTYKDTDYPITPHFDADTMKEMVDSGVISVQSHTYDLHQSAGYESGEARETILPLAGETEADYVARLRADTLRMTELISGITNETVDAMAYPKGAYSELAATVLAENGIKVTFTTEQGSNTVLKGVPQSLYGMHRYFVYESTTVDRLLTMVADARG